MIGKREARWTAALCAIAALLVAVPASAKAESYTNHESIFLPSNQGPGNPYPSAINVSGATGPVVKARASILGYQDPNPNADFMLVGPGGQSVVLWSDECFNGDLAGESFTFDDDAAESLAGNFNCGGESGTYKPAGPDPGDQPFPGEAAGFALGSSLSVFKDTPANGTWRLFARGSAVGGLSGQLTGGWSLDLEVAPGCASRTSTIAGTEGDDVLTGTPQADVFVGLAGKDTIKGLGGNDVLCGGGGPDTLIGGAGKDRLIGQGEKDKCLGGKGKDSAARTCETRKSV